MSTNDRSTQTAGWRPVATAPRSQRVLVTYQCGVIEIACQSNYPDRGWVWVSDCNEHIDDDDPITHWMPLPEKPL